MEINRSLLLNPTYTKELRRSLRNNATPEEKKLWQYLKNRQFKNLKFRRQYGIGPYIVDFYLPQQKLIIEVDGPVHNTPEQINHDKEREIFLLENGFKLFRVSNDEVNYEIEKVLHKIERWV